SCCSKVRDAATINKIVSGFGRMSGPAPELALLTFQSIAVGHRFEFHANGVGDGNDGTSFEREGRQHRTELMHFERIVTFHQHIPAPITDANDERLDLEIRGRFPRAEDLQNSLLCIFVLDGRALRTFIPSDHVLHDFSLSRNYTAGASMIWNPKLAALRLR